MSNLHSDVIKQHETPMDENGVNREYFVYRKDGKFVVECVEWKKKDMTRSGGSLEWRREYEKEEDALKQYRELLGAWEPESTRM